MKKGLVILNYNDSKTVIEPFRGGGGWGFDHIIIVDNKSTDNSYEELKEIENEKIKVIVSDKNGGYSYGNNVGILYLRQRYKVDIIFIANPDVIFTEANCDAMVRALQEDNVGIVSCVVKNIHNEIVTSYCRRPTFCSDFLDLFILFRRIKNHIPTIDFSKNYMPIELLPGSFFAFNASILKDDGKLFDESLFLYCEERVLADYTRNKGLKNYLITSESYIHNHSTSISKSYNNVRRYQLLIDSKKIYWKEINKIGKFKFFLFNLFCKYSIIELKIIYKIKNYFIK